MIDGLGAVFQAAVEFSHAFIPSKIKAAIESGPAWKRLVALSLSVIIWIAGMVAIAFVGLVILAIALQFRKPVQPDTLIYQVESKNSLGQLQHCLLTSPDGLNLREKFPPSSSEPVVRLGNSIRHVLIDIHDNGSSRTIMIYSRNRQPLYPKELSTVNRCRD